MTVEMMASARADCLRSYKSRTIERTITIDPAAPIPCAMRAKISIVIEVELAQAMLATT
jgi:hypothetical protein